MNFQERDASSKGKVEEKFKTRMRDTEGKGIYTPVQPGLAGHEQPGDRET
jgi:hypothetical protein